MVRNELEAIAGQRFHHLLKQRQYWIHEPGLIKRSETARQQLAYSRAPGKWLDSISGSMLQQENTPNGGPSGRSESRLAVPRRPVQKKRVDRTLLSYALRRVCQCAPHNNPVVTQHLDLHLPLPEASGRALAGTGMADKKKGLPVAANQTTCVQFYAPPQTQVVGNQQFIQRILQGATRILVCQAFPVENHARLPEIFIHQQTLIRPPAEPFGGEVEEKAARDLMHAPQATGVEQLASSARLDRGIPFDLHFNVLRSAVSRKGLQLRPEVHGLRGVSPDFDDDPRDRKAMAVHAHEAWAGCIGDTP
jgi:hypothetical protein